MDYELVVNYVNLLKKYNYCNNNRQINANRIYTENDITTCFKCQQQK